MSSMTRVGIHDVESITVKFNESDGSKWMDFTFTDSHGGRHEVTAFVDKPLAIEGAEFVALMAQPIPDDAPDSPGSLVHLLQASIEAAKAGKGGNYE